MPNKGKNYYNEQDSPFFRLRSRARLASLLYISQDKLQFLARDKSLYSQFKKPKSSGGYREINAPRDDLKIVQSRIGNLLQRISPPDYLFAPVSGRSYVDNAGAHLGAESVRLLDIEDFFPSCTGNRVIWFFRKRMQCSPDVAAILKAIVTREDSLAQGSPCSPILAYLCYVDMWEDISRIVGEVECTLSVYADDITISGKTVPEKMVWEVKKTLFKYGHRYHVTKERKKHKRPAEITGVILTHDGLRPPNRLHKRLYEVRRDLKEASTTKCKAEVKARIRGREAQMAQVKAGNLSIRRQPSDGSGDG